MALLVLNCGSSSLKYSLFEAATTRVMAIGVIERVGEANSQHHHTGPGGKTDQAVRAPSHREAFALMLAALKLNDNSDLLGIGHRVVHGGDKFTHAVRIDAQVRSAIKQLSNLAPLHNPPNLLGIELATAAFPHLPQVAVFDTAFHQTLPEHAYRYAVPEAWLHDHHIRRYGFHGISHEYVAQRAAAHLGRPLSNLNLITLHLGNGASAAAIQGGRCVDTSMGFTPLEGLVMGTRSGDLDPAIPLHLQRLANMDAQTVDDALNHASGLQGLAGANDMREILQRAEAGDAIAQRALDIYCYRIKKYIGAYCAVLGRIDALVFTAGVGENAAAVRALSCAGLESLGIAIDSDANAKPMGELAEIQSADSATRVLVIRTNEELQIARQVLEALRA